VRNKGGNLPGYSTLFAIVPELQLSVVGIWNGNADEFGNSDIAHNFTIPALVSALTPLQPGPNAGPSPNDYLGTYTSTCCGNLVVHMASETSRQFATVVYIWVVDDLQVGSVLVWSGLISLELNYFQADIYQAYIPPGILSCQSSQLEAISGQYIYFLRNATGAVTGSSLPGWAPGLVYTKS
jgi:hypothetical protein